MTNFRKVAKKTWETFAEWYLRVCQNSIWEPITIADRVNIKSPEGVITAYKTRDEYWIDKNLMKRWQKSVAFLAKRKTEHEVASGAKQL